MAKLSGQALLNHVFLSPKMFIYSILDLMMQSDSAGIISAVHQSSIVIKADANFNNRKNHLVDKRPANIVSAFFVASFYIDILSAVSQTWRPAYKYFLNAIV